MIVDIKISKGLIPIKSVRVEPIERMNNIHIKNITFSNMCHLNEYLEEQVVRANATPTDNRYSLKDLSVRITLNYCDGTELKITINDLSSITEHLLRDGKQFNIGLLFYNEQKQYISNLCERRRTEYSGDSLHILHPDWSTLCALDEEIKKSERFLNSYYLGIE